MRSWSFREPSASCRFSPNTPVRLLASHLYRFRGLKIAQETRRIEQLLPGAEEKL